MAITPHIGENVREVVATFGEVGDITTILRHTKGLSYIAYLKEEFPEIAKIHLGSSINIWPNDEGTAPEAYTSEVQI